MKCVVMRLVRYINTILIKQLTTQINNLNVNDHIIVVDIVQKRSDFFIISYKCISNDIFNFDIRLGYLSLRINV